MATHGRLKVKITEIEKEKLILEREKYIKQSNEIINKRKIKEYSSETLKLTKEFLIINPNQLTIWNYRKEIVNFLGITKEELILTEECLKISPKSYGIWYHRKWAIEQLKEPDLNHEIELCNLLLSYDARNFHCWNYRKLVGGNTKEYVYELLKKNFSNYTAWHYLSTLGIRDFEYVWNALYTDPEDECAWTFHRALVGKLKTKEEILEQINLTNEMLELLDIEEQKQILLNLVLMKKKIGIFDSTLIKKLIKYDPNRINLYKSL